MNAQSLCPPPPPPHTHTPKHTHTHTKTILRAGTPFNPTVMDLPPSESPITRAINANGSANHNNSIMAEIAS